MRERRDGHSRHSLQGECQETVREQPLFPLGVRSAGGPFAYALAQSFAHVPPGAFVRSADWLAFALALPRAIGGAALAVAAPALAVVVAIQTGVAIVARVVPRLGNFSLAFPIVFAGALIVTIATLPLLAPLGAHPWLVVPFAVRP